MQFGRKLRLAMTIGAAASALSLGLIAPTVSSAAAPSGTITAAEGPGANPYYIFPYYSASVCSVANTTQFQALMFRPLYWFGLGTSILLQPQLSTGNLPVYSNGNKTVTFTLKGWKFKDGQTVNAESVMFFLNMFKAVPQDFCTYAPGLGIPDQVANVKPVGTSKVVITLKTPVNPHWFTYNMLSTITPMPNSWDLSGPNTPAKCASGAYLAASTKVACTNVYNFLNKQGLNTSTYTSKMWQSGADGPWTLTKFDALGNATFTANPKYSGPQKAMVQYFKLVAFTQATAEENQLQAGALDLGFVDPSILTSPSPAPGKAGPNWGQLAARYKLISGFPYSTNYDMINFGGKSPNAAFFAQEYVRQALQESIDQAGIIKNAFKNYAVPDYSSIPTNTPASLSTPFANPLPFSLTKAAASFSSHGWTMQGGNLTCTSPGSGAAQCGAGIANGYQASINFEWVSGSPSLETENSAIVADWNSLGITVHHDETSFNAIFGSCPEAYAPNSTYDVCTWGGGWLFAPDYFPSGEPLWEPGASFNPGVYSNPTMTSLINQTITQNIKLTAYAKFTATDVPALWVPNNTAAAEVIKTLHSKIGFAVNPLENSTPEYLYW